jgi:hypothetical protein
MPPHTALIVTVAASLGVGLHFSLGDLMAVRRVSIPGVVRTHRATEQACFEDVLHTADAPGRAIDAEREAALSLAHVTLQTLGRSDDEADVIVESMRQTTLQPAETFAALHTREFRAMMSADPNHPEPPAELPSERL